MAAMTGAALAQDGGLWVRVELLPTLDGAQLAAQGYSEQLPDDVAGYELESGGYAVALGPYSQAEAEAVLLNLLAEGVIPVDSVISDGAEFAERVYPAGAAPQAPVEPDVTAQPADPAIPDETPAQAQASEAALSLGEKQQLQTALQWAGVYEGGIDGAFGPGTRNAMALWQAQNGHEPTGILTARQRAELLGAFNAILDGLGIETVRDERTGIQIDLPMAVLQGPVYEPPFARFDAQEPGGPQVVLISQPGDADRLAGLYEILQTLEIVPEEGERQRTEEAFAIEGRNGEIHSTTYAWLVDGQIKGFTLVWPAGDEDRRARLIETMRASFRRLPGVLEPAADAGEDQAVDLVSGLQVRVPERTATGFYVDARGTVVTTADAVAECREVTLDESTPARVVTTDPTLNLAVLQPQAELAPRAVAGFLPGAPRIGAEVAVAGYPYGGALSRPAVTFGTLADVRGLNGEEQVRRLDISTQPGDAGGPVLAEDGAVIGMMLPREGTRQVLPEDVAYALDAEAIRGVLASAGVEPTLAQAGEAKGAEGLVRDAGGLTVLVSCW
ncbi:peptidoglycan-binding protein [Rubellimicrobium roseum]|uniref:Peptidoglycan-binding protein n=2 Tax=Rubellimicrobium roseum TaxID=687525 RepID=A0A5C4NNG2_9RHOB|nr:peptidoglycan-binding protein [Rubellimicrobium roseum]